jgi:hypothetical protein
MSRINNLQARWLAVDALGLGVLQLSGWRKLGSTQIGTAKISFSEVSAAQVSRKYSEVL